MAFKVTDFKSNLKGGGARPSLFYADLDAAFTKLGIPFPNKSQFLIKGTTIPASTLGTYEVFFHGKSVKVAGDRTFDTWDTTIINDEELKKIHFSHNPFSMPNVEMDKFDEKDPLEILAKQYDLVCNGVEISSGAIRNHIPEIMYKAFEVAGYSNKDVDSQFAGLINAFKYGAPPHGGCAPGIDRIVMLLAGEPNIREAIAFPMNQKAQDLLMNAPSKIDPKRLKELGITIAGKKKDE